MAKQKKIKTWKTQRKFGKSTYFYDRHASSKEKGMKYVRGLRKRGYGAQLVTNKRPQKSPYSKRSGPVAIYKNK